MRVFGVDPGFGRLGYAVVDRVGSSLLPVVYGVVETDKGLPLPQRLFHLHSTIAELIHQHTPDCIATEAILFAANRTTALDVSKALGVVLLAAEEMKLPWREYTPPQVKLTVTGSGSANKKQVQFMVTRLLSLKETPKPDDVADALAVAICHAVSARMRAL
ncbi:MAG: crossover junction endodeoxyribonuclease RuvC [Armatimonadetes bacterium]|nr:crossover junction endodeoxyribonuclease RuvC [Armatimonadota bacterium]